MRFSFLNTLGLLSFIEKFIVILEQKTSKVAQYFREEGEYGPGEKDV